MKSSVTKIVAISMMLILASVSLVFASGSAEKGNTYTIKVGDNVGCPPIQWEELSVRYSK